MKAVLSLAVLALIGAVDLDKRSRNDKGDLAWNDDEDDSAITGEQSIAHQAFDTELLRGLSSSKVSEPEGTMNGMLPIKGSNPKYNTPFDHEGHKPDPIASDIPKVKIEKSVTKDGAFCQMHEWAIVNWKGFAEETGKPTIKKDKYKDGPAAFQVGTYKVSKCWEIAVQQMRSGEKATVTCPGELVDQSIDKTDDVYGKELGRKYELEVQECAMHPLYFVPENLRTDVCFYIRPSGFNGQGSNMALTVDSVDLYYPENYGIYNIEVKEFAGDKSDNKAQQWTYDPSTKALKTSLHPGKVMFEGANGNLIVYEAMGLVQQQFEYIRTTKAFVNPTSTKAFAVESKEENGQMRLGQNIISVDDNGALPNRFEVHYCNH